MNAQQRLSFQSGLISLLILLAALAAWHVATLPTGGSTAPASTLSAEQIEYQKLLGKDPEAATKKTTGFPTLAQMGATVVKNLSDPFYDNGPNDKGIAIQLGHSLLRVGLGFGLAALLAIPLGFLIGMSPVLHGALNPVIQVLRPVSPLAWMPLALFTIKDSSTSAIFVIFICAMWPLLLNTAFGVANVRREWLNVARTLEAGRWRTAFSVILPAAAPTIMTGARISIGIAWLVIVAAEMLVGGPGIGYFVWDQWNNLAIANIIVAILLIGFVGMGLDLLLERAGRAFAWRE